MKRDSGARLCFLRCMALEYTVTYLEMKARPAAPRKPAPFKGLMLVRAEEPPAHFFRYLYKAVGGGYEWNDLDVRSDAEIEAFAQDARCALYVAHAKGAPGGFALLDFRDPEAAELAYFGVTPEQVGTGLGSWLLMEAVHMAWDHEITLLTVNTCTLDHPRALPLYQKAGFAPVRREKRRRIPGKPGSEPVS